MSRALVISGGGSKGAFAVGVLKALTQQFPNLDFDIYVGTSAGSLVVTLASVKEFDNLERAYTTTKTTDILTRFNIVDRINEHSIYDATPAWNTILHYYPDDKYAKLQQSGKKVFLTTTCLQNGALNVFTNHAEFIQTNGYILTQLINADHYRKALMASICEPVFMQPIKVNLHVPGNPNPDYQYVDGGVVEYAGVQMAIDAGATEIFVILLSPAQGEPIDSEFTAILPILERTIDLFTIEVGNNDLSQPRQYNRALQYIAAVKAKMIQSGLSQAEVDNYFRLPAPANPFQDKEPLKIFEIRPKSFLGGGPGGLNFDPAEMKQMMAKGEAAVADFIASLPPDDITWD